MAWTRQRPEQETLPSTKPLQTAPPDPVRVPLPQAREEKPMEALVNIGQSVEIKGTLTGNEDLTIGANGRINAEVHAKKVVVLGQVTGNITADDKVEIAPSGTVQGDVRAPRVSIADGANFKGSIDMDKRGGAATAGASTHAPAVHTPQVQVATMGGGGVPGGLNRPAAPQHSQSEARLGGTSTPKG